MQPRYLMSVVCPVLLLTSAVNVGAQPQSTRFVPDVIGQFNALNRRPDPMGFELYGPDPSQCRHLQALNRTEAGDGTPYFIVSRSGPPRDNCFEEIVGIEGNPIANLYIVRMGSRDKNGERLRNNRMRRGLTTSLTPPDPEDRVVRSISYDGPTFPSEFPHYDHPGGMQQVGSILAVGVEFPPLIRISDDDDPFPIYIPDPSYPAVFVHFLDVTDPENPRQTSKFVPTQEGVRAGTLALTPCGAGRVGVPCATGHYLLAVTGGNNETLFFYESKTTECLLPTDAGCRDETDLASQSLSWRFLDTWEADHGFDFSVNPPEPLFSPDETILGANWPASHQTLMFIREGNLGGALYLAGARGGRALIGSVPDMIDLYRVELDGDQVRMTSVSSRHLISHAAGEGEDAGARLANFSAASTFYVSPSGELIFYASEHDNDGPDGTNDRGSVKMGEWRHVAMVRPDSPTLSPTVDVGGPFVVDEGGSVVLDASGGPPATKAWIQLYEHENYTGRNVVLDYDDWNKDDFDDFKHLDPGFIGDVNGASDEATSWRSFAPSGCTIRANDDDVGDSNFPGADTRTLPGDGATVGNFDLHLIANDTNSGDVNDSFTSAQFFPDCAHYYSSPISVAWDLNRDGVPDTTGTTVSFVASDVDGPSTLNIGVSASHPIDGSAASAFATIVVNNVAPAIDSVGAFNSAGHAVPFFLVRQPVIVRGTFSDPGRLDHQTASLQWGDGATDSTFETFADAFGGQEGQLQHRHAYTTAGAFDVALDVTDDDLGTARAGRQVVVKSPEQAVGTIIEMIDALISLTSDPKARKLLIQARKALAGDVAGFGKDGALYKLQQDQDAAAIGHLQNALNDLGSAGAAGVDVSVLVALIQVVAAAVAADV